MGQAMRRTSMLRSAFLGSAVIVMVGCATTTPPLYMWDTFPRQQYDVLLGGVAGTQDQIRALEAHAEKARASHAALPPGFRAHLGMLHLTAGNSDEARRLWHAEKESFPEAAPYMDQLLKRLDSPTTSKTTNRENPA